jgi:hypothetical protein
MIGKRFVVRADEKLTAFLELERVTRESLHFQNANDSAQFSPCMDTKPSILGPNDPLVPVLERLVEIGWIRGFAHSPGRGLTLDYTELGESLMKPFGTLPTIFTVNLFRKEPLAILSRSHSLSMAPLREESGYSSDS